jgi:hypothetical protein
MSKLVPSLRDFHNVVVSSTRYKFSRIRGGGQVPNPLKELHTLLEEHMDEWIEGWKEEGRREGYIEAWRSIVFPLVFTMMEVTRGPIPEEIRRRAKQIRDLEELTAFANRLLSSSSFSDLLQQEFPNLQVPEVQDLKEMKSVLEENIRLWREEARQEGWQEGAHDMLLSQMEGLFGPLPEEVRRRVEEIHDPEELKSLGIRLLSTSSLSDLLH